VLNKRETHQKRISTRAIIYSEPQSLNQPYHEKPNSNSFLSRLLKEFQEKSFQTIHPDIEVTGHSDQKKTLLIAVDGGANYLHEQEIIPDIVIGDMDSIKPETLKYYRNLTEIKSYPARKNETDTELALRWCLDNNNSAQTNMFIDEILFINTLQGSFAHSLGILSLLFSADEQGIGAEICTDQETIFLLPEMWHCRGKIGTKISLISLTEKATGIETEGLEYPLCRETLFRNSTRGISNVFVDEEIRICYTSGRLLVIIESTLEDLTWK